MNIWADHFHSITKLHWLLFDSVVHMATDILIRRPIRSGLGLAANL